MAPTDDQLRRFLLGSLPPVEASAVARWVEATPEAADRLARVDTADPLPDAIARGPTPAGPERLPGAAA